MPTPSDEIITTYMQINCESHRDIITDELYVPDMAEDAYLTFEPKAPARQDIPEIYFELALEVQNQERV